MHLKIILLEEWNDGAVALILSLFIGAALVVFFILWGILRFIPETRKFLERLKVKSKVAYLFFLFLLFLISAYSIFLFSYRSGR